MYRIMGALSLSCLLLTGCIDSQTRMKIAEETEKENDLGVATIRDITEIGPGSDAPMQVSGVGLITGLAGTGHSPNGPYRDILEQYLLKHNTTRGGEMAHDGTDIKVRKILDNPNNALVIVTGFIPPGAHKGDRFDVDIKLPPASKTSSLAGGYLQLCTLRVYAAASDLSGRSQYANSQKLLAGHIVAHAKGRLFTGFGNNADSHELKHARVWQAGVSRVARPYSFVMRDDRKSLGIASDVARRINFMYQEDPNSPARRFEFNQQENRILAMGLAANQLNQNQDPYGIHANDVAKASKECIIHVRVPAIYRFDHERFQRVACLTPLRDNDPNLNRYRQRLQAMVLNPRECQRAAFRLEAMGRESIPALKKGLDNEHPFVRFVCAESLAYLGSTAGVETLTDLARNHSILAKNCTIALANLSETIARDKLAELLADDDPALRCAAFYALNLLDENDPRLNGKYLADSFWLYRVPQTSSPMVYFSTSKRAQIVVFGKNVVLAPDTRMMVGTGKEFTIANDKDKDKFVIKRFTLQGEAQRVVSNRLDETLTALSELGASYPDVIDFLRRAQTLQRVNCPIVHWSVPDVSLETLMEEGPNLAPTSRQRTADTR